MLTWEDDVEVHALHKRGWSISAIARHTGFDRKTIRGYLSGERTPGVRARPSPDPFEPFVEYVTARLREDPHLWARTLLDELEELGFPLSYPSLTRNIRQRVVCGRTARPAGQRPIGSTRSFRTSRGTKPSGTGWICRIHRPRGGGVAWRICWSARWRIRASGAAGCRRATDQPHLVEGLDRVTRALGGVTLTWRFDRMATVCDPGTGRITASFAGVAKHYSVAVAVCPPRSGNRKGVVEKANLTAAQRWWRTLPDDVTAEQAQADLDRFAVRRGDTRVRVTAEGRSTVAAVADTEPLAPFPQYRIR